ncbi:hypothetical protein ACU680_10045 [Pseudomonas koreensis]
MATKNKIFLKLCLIYGCRYSEKAHFDFRAMIWTVPPANHKMGKSSGKPLLRPITPETENHDRPRHRLFHRGVPGVRR